MLNLFTGSWTKMELPELKKVDINTGAYNPGSRWSGIKHSDLVEGLLEVLDELFGIVPLNPVYAVNPSQTMLLGGFDLGKFPSPRHKKPVPIAFSGLPNDAYHSIGFIHGNDSSKALRIGVGGRVAICENGMFTGDLQISRRHTTGLNLLDFLRESLENLETALNESQDFMVALMDPKFKIGPTEFDRALLELARSKAVNWSDLGAIDRTWRTAIDHDFVDWAGEQQDHWVFAENAWNFYNAVTWVIRRMTPARQMPALRRLASLLVSMLPERLRPDRPKSLILDVDPADVEEVS